VHSVRIKVPEYRYPLYRSTGIRFKKVILRGFLWLLHVVALQPVQLIAHCRVGWNGTWDVTNMRARGARAPARAIKTQSITAIIINLVLTKLVSVCVFEPNTLLNRTLSRRGTRITRNAHRITGDDVIVVMMP
jgi:hypothetical protein